MAESSPPGFTVWFPFLFMGMWAAANFMFAERSGWRLLGRKYKVAVEPDGQRFRRQVYGVGGLAENGVTRMVVSPRGLYLAPLLLFRIGRDPVLIPWSAIVGVVRGRTWGRTWYNLNIDGITLIRVGQDAFHAMRAYVPAPVDAAA
jgi:hypothetical protein